MALSLKRSCSDIPFSSVPRAFKKCRKLSSTPLQTKTKVQPLSTSGDYFFTQHHRNNNNNNVTSSSDEDEESDLDSELDQVEEEEYINSSSLSERKKSILRRRSSTRSAADTPLNIQLSRAVALYSDDEDDEIVNTNNNNVEEVELNNKDSFKVDQKINKDSETKNKKTKDINTTTPTITTSRSISDADRCARYRCFDYLVSAIDEAWARYCDATSTYGDEESQQKQIHDDDDEEEGHEHSHSISQSELEENCSDATTSSLAETEFTDYSDFNVDMVKGGFMKASTSQYQQQQQQQQVLQHNQQTSLQNLKDRLTNAKYYLQDFVDSDDYEDCIAFWKRWDMVKYCTVELVEDDEEEDIVEVTIDDLEKGRCPSTV